MKKGIVLLALLGGLLAEGVTVYAGTFNVRDYGAVGDDKTDNTAAFSKCLNALIAAGGGKMFIPDGVYQGRIIIPPVSKPTPSWITVEIVGESEPAPVFGTIGDFPLQNHGTIVKSLETNGTAVISASAGGMYMWFSGVYVVIRNLDVRTSDNPGISGIDLTLAVQCRLENVFINTGVYNVQASKPTHGAKGLITPLRDNAALTILRNVTVTGYQTGIVVYEHTDGDNIVVAGNIHGLDFGTSHHASRFGRVGAYRNTHHITVSGRHGFSIEQLATEQPGPGQTTALTAWQTLVSDVNDPQNMGIADINYWVIVGNVGAVDQFVRTGGANIRTRRIGATSAAAVPEVSGPNGGFELPGVGSGGYVELPVGGKVGGWTHAEGTESAWIVSQDYAAPQLPAAADGQQMLEIDHRSKPYSLLYRSLGKREVAGDVTVSARFALRDFNAGPPVPDAEFQLLLLAGAPGKSTSLADSGKLKHTAVKTWVKHAVTAKSVSAGTELFVAIRAYAFGTQAEPVFTLVDDVKAE